MPIMTATISGDVHSSADVNRELGNIVTAFVGLVRSNEQARSNLARERVTGAPMDFLSQVQSQYAALATSVEARATRFADHVSQQREWVAANPSVAETFYGTWMDPRKNG